jgi:hypothetical protein
MMRQPLKHLSVAWQKARQIHRILSRVVLQLIAEKKRMWPSTASKPMPPFRHYPGWQYGGNRWTRCYAVQAGKLRELMLSALLVIAVVSNPIGLGSSAFNKNAPIREERLV